MDRTLVILKPDAVQRGLVGEIIQRFEKKGIKIVKILMMQPSQQLIEQHYQEHKDKPFYQRLVNHMVSGPSVFIILEGNNIIPLVRKMVGSTLSAEPGTIRGDFAEYGERNIIHASDSGTSAEREIKLFFEE